jgi:superfamily II DNA/RNA helicase
MFSATWPLEIQRVANTYVTKNTVHIKIGKNDDEGAGGDRGATANTDITQEVSIIMNPRAKFDALKNVMKKVTKNNTEPKKILIFCLYKMNVDRLEGNMLNDRDLNAAVDYEAWGIHGGNSQ